MNMRPFLGPEGGAAATAGLGAGAAGTAASKSNIKVIRNLKLSYDKNCGAKYLDIFQGKLCLTGAGAGAGVETSATPVST